MLPVKGVYTLILFLSKETRLKVGKLGTQRFPRGYYTYTGSALGVGSSSLTHRILRHLRRKKRKFWHVDFLLGHENVRLTRLVAAQINRKVECNINHHIKTKEKAKIPVPHFGASDCKKNCRSHLLFYPNIMEEQILVKKIVKSYKDLDLTPYVAASKHMCFASDGREQTMNSVLQFSLFFGGDD